nr:ATPase subunit 4 [Gahnia tristis]
MRKGRPFLMRWSDMNNMQYRKMLFFAAILSICALSSKKILIYNEEMIVAACFLVLLILSRNSFGNTFKETLDGRIESIQEELEQFFKTNEVSLLGSNEKERHLKISLRICGGTVVESFQMGRYVPKCEKTVQALLCRNLKVKLATLLNAISSRRIRIQDDIVKAFHFSVSERFLPTSKPMFKKKATLVGLIREGLVVLRKVSFSFVN